MMRLFFVLPILLLACASEKHPLSSVLPPDDEVAKGIGCQPLEPFNIELVFPEQFPLADRAIAEKAARRWEQVIVEGLYDVDFAYYPEFQTWWSDALARNVEINGIVDDVRVHIEFRSISPYMGLSAPFISRIDTALPLVAGIALDTSFFRGASTEDKYYIILHEFGHALGFGNIHIWKQLGLIQQGFGQNFFIGRKAQNVFDRLSNNAGTQHVPLDAAGGHWHQSKLRNELMTSGWAGTGRRVALSGLTIAALEDMGYKVDGLQAEFFQIPAPASTSLAGFPASKTHSSFCRVIQGPVQGI